MDQRGMKILSAIIDEYIRTGEPVGSKTLAEMSGIGVSSATIRNTMAALEQEGYLDHPHTSAGRVPTFKGFRYYIDHLMRPEPLSAEKISQIDRLLEEGGLTDEAIVENAGTALAEITKCAAISTNHAAKFSVISKVDVIPTGRRVYVLLMITSNGAVKNKVCRMEFDLTNEHIQSITGFLNEHLCGMNVENMSEEYVNGVVAAMSSYMLSLSPLIKAVYELSEEMMRDSVEVRGEANLLACRDFEADDVMKFLENKSELTEFLDGAFSGINVMFSEENGSGAFPTFAISNSTLVSTNYYKDGKKAGTLGIIGPMRIDYRKVIPYIEYLSRKVSTMLSENESKNGSLEIENKTEDKTKGDDTDDTDK